MACQGKPLTVEEYVANAWHLNYTWQVCQGSLAPSRAVSDERTGLASIASRRATQEIETSVAGGRARFDGTSARQCIDALNVDWSSCWGTDAPRNPAVLALNDRGIQQLVLLTDLAGLARQYGDEGWLEGAPPRCAQVVTGLLDDGDACYQSYECKSGVCFDPGYQCCAGCDCSYTRLACPGVCMAAPGEGQPCSFNPAGGRCALGLVCSAGTCRKPADQPGSGAAGAGTPCASAFCSGHQLCVAKPTVCGSGVCAGAASCSVPQDVGGPCAPVGDRYGLSSGCFEPLYCNAMTGRCDPPPRTGDSCSCTRGGADTTGICRFLYACDPATAYCDGQTCQPLVADGSPCNLSRQCRSRTCTGSGTTTGSCVTLPSPPFPACVAP